MPTAADGSAVGRDDAGSGVSGSKTAVVMLFPLTIEVKLYFYLISLKVFNLVFNVRIRQQRSRDDGQVDGKKRRLIASERRTHPARRVAALPRRYPAGGRGGAKTRKRPVIGTVEFKVCPRCPT